jgi:uncharacterized protein (DUF924 family)
MAPRRVKLDPEAVLAFWFPPLLDASEARHREVFQFWFQGGADARVGERFQPAVEAAACGDLEAWADAARSRLALILLLDQLPRCLWRDSARQFGGDGRALGLALEGLERGHYRELATPWEKMFFVLPLGHSEEVAHHDRALPLLRALPAEAPEHLRKLYEYSAMQAHSHREVVARFGRHPQRNALLGRPSTPAELSYLASLAAPR